MWSLVLCGVDVSWAAWDKRKKLHKYSTNRLTVSSFTGGLHPISRSQREISKKKTHCDISWARPGWTCSSASDGLQQKMPSRPDDTLAFVQVFFDSTVFRPPPSPRQPLFWCRRPEGCFSPTAEQGAHSCTCVDFSLVGSLKSDFAPSCAGTTHVPASEAGRESLLITSAERYGWQIART